jgi:hypothetical protein
MISRQNLSNYLLNFNKTHNQLLTYSVSQFRPRGIKHKLYFPQFVISLNIVQNRKWGEISTQCQTGQLTVTSNFIRHFINSRSCSWYEYLRADFWFVLKDFFHASTAQVGLGLLWEVSWLHSDKPQSAGLLWTSDRPIAETCTWQQKTLTIQRLPCPRRDSNSQSQQRETVVRSFRSRDHQDRRVKT